MRTCALLLLALIAAAARAGEPLVVRVDAKERRQKIAGFGGTVGWIYPKEEKLEEVADLLFTDLGASILRLSALSKNGDATDEDSPERVNDNDDPNRINWRGFDFEPCEDEQARIAAAARKRGLRTVVAASWSPPGWMKTNGSRKLGGNLRKGMDAELAELWTAYLLWMRRKRKLGFAALSIQNEPEVPRPYPTADFSAEELDRAARALIARARAEKVEARLLYPEVSQLGRLKPYLEGASRETLAATGAISVHCYSLSVNYYQIDRYRGMWRETRRLVKPYRKPLWMTEFSNYAGAFSGQDQGSWREALAWARHLHVALVEGECSAVLFWGLYFDKKGEALVYAKENKAEKYEITPKFYTSKNYYRFVRPGAVRLGCTPTEGKLECSAFWHPRSRELAVVVINPGEGEVLASVRVDGLGIPERTAMHRTSRAEKCAELDPRRQQVDSRRLRFPAESVTTLLFGYGKRP
ncbi:MAG: glycoside hydrolase [Planctomycetota bacterium]|jgi:O-glycosyl hydrolase